MINERERSGAKRNDLIDTLVELRTEDKNKVFNGTDVGLSFLFKINFDFELKIFAVFHGDILVAQAAIFFTGGFETTASTISFGIFELAKEVSVL